MPRELVLKVFKVYCYPEALVKGPVHTVNMLKDTSMFNYLKFVKIFNLVYTNRFLGISF